MVSATEAVDRLRLGNQRFASGTISLDALIRQTRRNALAQGHSQCGPVQATLEQLDRPALEQSRSLFLIVERIRPPGVG